MTCGLSYHSKVISPIHLDLFSNNTQHTIRTATMSSTHPQNRLRIILSTYLSLLLLIVIGCTSTSIIAPVESFTTTIMTPKAPTLTKSSRHDPHRLLSSSGTSDNSIVEYNDFLPNPNPDIEGPDVVRICMESLGNAKGETSEGLEVCFNFSSDHLKAFFGGNLERFLEHANNPVFASLVKCTEWEIVSIGPVIPGTNTRGAMQTVLMDVKAPEQRRFLWTLQRERRPPRQNCWLVHECLFVKNAFQLTT